MNLQIFANKFVDIRKAILDFLFPKFCLGCGREKTYLCPECFSKIKIFSSPFCPYCGARVYNGKICQDCKKSLSGFIAAAPYGDKLLEKLIDAFKYHFVKELATPLAFLILKFLQQNQEIEFLKNPLDFLILPIPLHKRRQRERGFNQASEIGKALSPLLKIPMREDILLRKKYTQPQAKLKSGREENIKDAFEIKPAFANSAFVATTAKEAATAGKKIILLDDVATSLSTMEEAAKVLKQNSTKEVWGLVIAKG
jgi:ComF family protein